MNIDPAELAYAIGTSEEEIRCRRYTPLGSNHFSFFGLDVHRSSIEARVRRFSPSSLACFPFHRAIWELRDLPFCPFGWDLLQDRCPCEGVDGIVQGWTRTLSPVECCDRCGEPLHKLASISIPKRMHQNLSLILTLAGTSEADRALGKPLPARLAKTDRSLLFDVVRRLTRAISPTPGYDSQDPESSLSRCEAMHTACRAMLMWPTGIYALNPGAHVSSPAWAKLLASYLSCGSADSITTAHRQSQVYEHEGGALEKPAQASGAIKLLGMRPASEVSGIKDDLLVAFWNDGAFTQHRRSHGGRMLPAIDPSELREFASRWHDRVELDAFAYKIGISLHGVEQLIVLGLLPATAPALPGTPSNLTSAAAADFTNRVTSGATSNIGEAIPLRRAVLSIGGRLKPWGPILAELLAGKIAYSVCDSGRTLLDRIVIDEKYVCSLSKLKFDRTFHPEFPFSDRMVQNDALATLNIPNRSSGILKGISSRGTNPRTYAVRDVEQRAAEVITITEIAFAAGLGSNSTYNRLKRLGFEPVLPYAYSRSVITPELHVIASLEKAERTRSSASNRLSKFS